MNGLPFPGKSMRIAFTCYLAPVLIQIFDSGAKSMAKKTNCWEFKNCGREVGGKNAQQLGVCPASKDNRANGIHGGTNGGRCCWALTGTLCGGAVQGSFATKIGNCNQCDFHQVVKGEETVFMDNTDILYKVKFGR
jgi:hypothetical protein